MTRDTTRIVTDPTASSFRVHSHNYQHFVLFIASFTVGQVLFQDIYRQRKGGKPGFLGTETLHDVLEGELYTPVRTGIA